MNFEPDKKTNLNNPYLVPPFQVSSKQKTQVTQMEPVDISLLVLMKAYIF